MEGYIDDLVRKDLDLIKLQVEREFNIELLKKDRHREYVDARKVFVALILHVYNDIREKLGEPRVTLASLAYYMKYKNHSSISFHNINGHKGGLGVEEFLMTDKNLRESYLKLKDRIGSIDSEVFIKFLSLKKQELKEEIKVIDKYLNIYFENAEKEEKGKSNN
tara:strand:+ start:1271 stop:1762 length:492 start_codon:yes stop_codon:yes gene_type:complete